MTPFQRRGRLAAVTVAAALIAAPLAAVAQTPSPASPSPPASPAATPQPAPPVPQALATAGLWTAFAANGSDQRPICGISTTGADGRRIVVQQTSGETGIEILLDKPSWAIPDNTPIDVSFQFDNGPAAAERAAGAGTQITADLPFDRSVAFMRSLRLGSQIRVYFPSGNETVWTGGLRGTSAMIDAFNDCRGRFATTPVTGPTQPFASPPRPQGSP